MLFGVYDAGARRLTVANAGAPYPLLVRNGNIEEIRVGGIPLGLFVDSEYEISSIDLLPGDVVIIASDGILESINAEKEEFGSERLVNVLQSLPPQGSAESVSDAILYATDQFTGFSASPHDDRTLLVLRVTDAPTADFSKLPVIY